MLSFLYVYSDHSILECYNLFSGVELSMRSFFVISSIGQSTLIQKLDKKRPTLPSLNQTQNRRRYVNFENGSRFICSLNLNNPESTVFIVFIMTNIASGDQEIVNSLTGNNNEKINSKFITFYKTFGGLGLLISKAQPGAYVAISKGWQ